MEVPTNDQTTKNGRNMKRRTIHYRNKIFILFVVVCIRYESFRNPKAEWGTRNTIYFNEESKVNQSLTPNTKHVQDKEESSNDRPKGQEKNHVEIHGDFKPKSNVMVPEIDYNYTFIRYNQDYKVMFPLPQWMEDFLSKQPTGDPQKHHEMLTDPSNKFLVMTCYKYKYGLEDCGGFTDRLFNLVYNMWSAHQTGRKLLIKYVKPRPLEDFLVPPPPADHGFNWMLPDGYFTEDFDRWANRTAPTYKADRRRRYSVQELNSTKFKDEKVVLINNNLAIPHCHLPSSWNYTKESLLPGLFRRFFQPSRETARRLSLIPEITSPGNYVAAHMRIKWPKPYPGGVRLQYTNTKWWLADKGLNTNIDMTDITTFRTIADVANHAVECAVRVMPETRYVYVASDAHEAIDYLKHTSPFWSDDHSEGSPSRSWAGFVNSSNVTAFINHPVNQSVHGFGIPTWEIPTTAKIAMRHDYKSPSHHFDTKARFKKPEPGVYGTIVDLWIMAHAGASSIGVGGYGRFGSVLSGNNSQARRSRHRDYDNFSPSCATSAERKAWKKMMGVAEAKKKR